MLLKSNWPLKVYETHKVVSYFTAKTFSEEWRSVIKKKKRPTLCLRPSEIVQKLLKLQGRAEELTQVVSSVLWSRSNQNTSPLHCGICHSVSVSCPVLCKWKECWFFCSPKCHQCSMQQLHTGYSSTPDADCQGLKMLNIQAKPHDETATCASTFMENSV